MRKHGGRLCYKVGVRREFSAGAVVVRRLRGRPVMAAIRPAGKPEGTWALPKGLIGPEERAELTALREVTEETGVASTPVSSVTSRRAVSSATSATSTPGPASAC